MALPVFTPLPVLLNMDRFETWISANPIAGNIEIRGFGGAYHPVNLGTNIIGSGIIIQTDISIAVLTGQQLPINVEPEDRETGHFTIHNTRFAPGIGRIHFRFGTNHSCAFTAERDPNTCLIVLREFPNENRGLFTPDGASARRPIIDNLLNAVHQIVSQRINTFDIIDNPTHPTRVACMDINLKRTRDAAMANMARFRERQAQADGSMKMNGGYMNKANKYQNKLIHLLN